MNIYQNPKIVGAFLIGLAMVLGSYVLTNFGKSNNIETAALNVAAVSAPSRLFVPVTDTNTDGIEDWRDQLVTAPAADVTKIEKTDYTRPTTLTGQLGISLMEDLIVSKGGTPVIKTEEQVVSDVVAKLGKTVTSDYIYGIRDITILQQNTSTTTIRTYGNTMADILLTESVPDLENEIILLRDFLANYTEESKPDKLITLANVYKNYRDKTIATPVPKIFVKEHLDLINVYNAMYLNIEAMTKVINDPMMPFIRLKRYEDDVKGLSLAYANIYDALVPYARVFEMNDSAILFANFYPGKQ